MKPLLPPQSRVLCDLFPLVLETSLSPTYANCPIGLLRQAQLLPTGIMVPEASLSGPLCLAPCTKDSGCLRQSHHPVTIPGRPHQPGLSHPPLSYPHSSYLVSLTVTFFCLTGYHPEGELQQGKGLVPSASTVSGTQRACNKYL